MSAAQKTVVAINGKSIEELDRELAAELKRQHGISKVHVFESGTNKVFVRSPQTGVWRRFRSQMQEAKRRDEASEQLFRACLLHPSQEVFNAMLEDEPGLLDTFASELCEVAGLAKEVEKKVL